LRFARTGGKNRRAGGLKTNRCDTTDLPRALFDQQYHRAGEEAYAVRDVILDILLGRMTAPAGSFGSGQDNTLYCPTRRIWDGHGD